MHRAWRAGALANDPENINANADRFAMKAMAGSVADWLARRASRLAQRRAERLHASMRAQLLKSDQWQLKTLAFSGKSE